MDRVGGTSIGAFIGALYARDVDRMTAHAFARAFSNRMSSLPRQLLDLTYPLTSWFTGHAFNRSLWKMLGDRQIEDLWLPYYAVTTDIVHSRMLAHRSGSLWRYVRASMSLSGFLPPLYDEGALLVDGGYMDNVPVDLMKSLSLGASSSVASSPSGSQDGAALIIAIDVGAEDEGEVTDYGDTLSGWWLLFQRLIGRQLQIPTLPEIQSRLAYVSCVGKLEAVRQAALDSSSSGVYYLRPPVTAFGVMDFAKHEQIYQIGYDYGRNLVEQWRSDGTLKRFLGFNNITKEDPTAVVQLEEDKALELELGLESAFEHELELENRKGAEDGGRIELLIIEQTTTTIHVDSEKHDSRRHRRHSF